MLCFFGFLLFQQCSQRVSTSKWSVCPGSNKSTLFWRRWSVVLSRLGPPAGKNNQYGLGVRTSETFPSNNHWLNSLLKLGTSVSLSKREPAYKASPSHFNLNMRYRHEENWGQLQTRATLISKLTPTQMLIWGLCLILSNHGKDPLLGLEN